MHNLGKEHTEKLGIRSFNGWDSFSKYLTKAYDIEKTKEITDNLYKKDGATDESFYNLKNKEYNIAMDFTGRFR